MVSAANVAAATIFLLLTVSFIGLVVGAIEYYASTTPKDRVAAWKFLEYYAFTTLILAGPAVFLRKRTVTSILEGFIVVSISWLLIPLLSAFSYMYTVHLDFVDAYFESLSGFSGTGLTMFSKPQTLPHVVLLWRAVTQWIGELGVVVFAGTLLPTLHRVIRSVYIVERGERIAPTIISTMRRLLGIYAVYTAIGTIMFMLSGMNFFDALTHSMTAIATGGMSTQSLSIGYWFRGHNWAIYASTIVIMILGAFNFADHDLLFRGKIKQFFTSLETKWLFIFLAIFTAPLALYAYLTHSLTTCFPRWFYHLVSGYTTTGFQLGSSTLLYKDPPFVKMILILSMIVGGATFSTAGGIKIKRAVIILKSITWSSAKIFAPSTMVLRLRVGREHLDERDVLPVYSFVLTYILTLIIISVAIQACLNLEGIHQFNYIDSLFETASALSCVGLSVGITSISAPLAVKILLMIAMYLGRLEFAPIYLLLGYGYLSKVFL